MTPTSTPGLEDVLERVRACKGASIELDARIVCAFLPGPSYNSMRSEGYSDADLAAGHPAYTASIDAALALVERKLPGCKKSFTELVDGWLASVLIADNERPEFVAEDFHAEAPTAPLAILTALLLALTTLPQEPSMTSVRQGTKLTLTRDIPKSECPWLDDDLKSGAEFFEYSGHTYGCIGPYGIAVSVEDGVTPFFEVPREALSRSNGEQP